MHASSAIQTLFLTRPALNCRNFGSCDHHRSRMWNRSGVIVDAPTKKSLTIATLKLRHPLDIEAWGPDWKNRRMTSLDALRALPRFRTTQQLIDRGAHCEICQESFQEGEEVTALPCIHQLYHILPVVSRPLAYFYCSRFVC